MFSDEAEDKSGVCLVNCLVDAEAWGQGSHQE